MSSYSHQLGIVTFDTTDPRSSTLTPSPLIVMAVTESLSGFLYDFGVSCTAGATTALGILDMPSQVVAGDMVLTTDYVLTALATDFGSLKYQDSITVAGTAYMVRETRFIDDGSFVEIGLQKT